MKICCCVKHVPDTNTQIQLSGDKRDIARTSINFVMSPYDEYAVEEALRIKEKISGSTVSVYTMGPARADQVLRTGLAMGIDDAVHVLDENSEVSDPLVTAKCLATAIGEGNYDLIFCGRQAVDDDAFQVGGALAALLGIGSIAMAVKVTVAEDGKSVTVEKVIEGGVRQTLTGHLPILITAQKGLNEPRFASLPGIMKAKSKPVVTKKIAELGVDLTPHITVESMELPVYERKKHVIPANKDRKEAVKELIDLLRSEAKAID